MKPNKIDDNFFEKYNKPDNQAYQQLSPSIIGAIQLLIDLKKKIVIYDKCYKNAGPTKAPMHAPAQAPAVGAAHRHSIKPGHHDAHAAVLHDNKVVEGEMNEMVGGRRRRGRKTKKARKGTRRSRRKGTKKLH
jgi:hypothetical protein